MPFFFKSIVVLEFLMVSLDKAVYILYILLYTVYVRRDFRYLIMKQRQR